jgi:threonine/homoserine/homoserine lactone efflux protein
MLVDFTNALILGFAIAVPVGPVSLLCMQRTLTLGRAAGLATGLGVAAADAFYAVLVAGGLSVAAELLMAQAPWLTFGAGICLVFLGILILRASPSAAASGTFEGTLGWSFMSGFLLTVTNPVAIVLLVAGFAVLGLAASEIDLRRGALLVAGIFLGSTLWWVTLVAGVSLIHRQIAPATVRWINRAAGLVIVLFGIFALWQALV